MNVHLTYQSGQSYSETLSNFDVKVSRGPKRVKISFKEKGNGHGYSSLSLQAAKAQQLAHAILTACTGDVKPIEFAIEEPPITQDVGA
ncbi:MAG: hypothetical protein WA817_23885 [Candidatus Acidiferrum sp.]